MSNVDVDVAVPMEDHRTEDSVVGGTAVAAQIGSIPDQTVVNGINSKLLLILLQ